MTYRKTVLVPVGSPVPTDLQPGQWVKLGNAKRSSRFVGYDTQGSILVQPVRGKGTSVAAFRLARNKAKATVLGVVR